MSREMIPLIKDIFYHLEKASFFATFFFLTCQSADFYITK